MNIVNSSTLAFPELLQKTLRCSRYAKRTLDTDPQLLDWLQENFTAPCSRQEMQELLQRSGLNLDDETGLARAMRRLRKQVMVKLMLRDLNGLAGLDEVMQTMTALAELCVQRAHACLTSAMHAQFGAPADQTGAATQDLLVIAMGKLGGGELNVSSDIDLIFVYPEDGETAGPRSPRITKSGNPLPAEGWTELTHGDAAGYPTAEPLPSRRLGNHEYFTRLGRRLISMISEHTADGYVFRVDMRLRPYGESGPLVTSFAALEEYLVSQGREWERYAWIKARVISPAQDPQRPSPHAAELSRLVRPFIYRKYLDYGAIDSMRKLHAQIRQEVQRRNRLNNIKLGPGGIREIEFTAQVFQLIRGGGDARLRIRPTRSVLQRLAENAQMSSQEVAALDAAYVFLRNLEHRLQYLDDRQTQELPESAEDREIIACGMGYADYAAFMNELDRHRALVSRQFEQIFGAQQQPGAPLLEHAAKPQDAAGAPQEMQLWHEAITVEELNAALEKLGYHDIQNSAQRLLQLRRSGRYQHLPELSRQRLDRLIPQFIALSAQHSDPDATLSRLLALLEGISGRAAYLAFLAEYPLALRRLTRLIAASSWASAYLTLHPALLDELLDAREIYHPPQWRQIDQELQTRLDDCADDAERQLDVLRHTQQEQTFHLLAMDLQGLLPLETLSDHLSDLADLMLRHVLKLSWATLRNRHRDEPAFAIIAYGKLGGRELGYASDLDLIFLYHDDHPDAQQNYARLAQRINTMLSSYTSSGRLYETDLRLRPDGASGLLVSTIAAFSEYQQKHAWVWEHQALTRARFSAGDERVGAEFERIRKQVLCRPRDLAALRQDILAMRQKMHDGHPNRSGLFDIKHDSGGMVDIEFMVQYLVLAHAHEHPQLCANAGNLALLRLAGELGLIPVELAEQVRQLYRELRQIQHRMRLNSISPCRIERDRIDTRACGVLWGSLLGGSSRGSGAEPA
ncbi:MAG: bifunctional [glutamate--ammonia ligase]-adenylyl-L-tyrosine phosphorylase/[glutamate--ammonia-ligase] adenylyltransferase [Gallionella sp.]